MDPEWGIVLGYDPKVARPNTWCLSDAADGVVIRACLGESPESTLSVRLRVYTPRAMDPEAWRAREVRDGLWRVGPIKVWPNLGPCWVFLRDCPPWVREMFRRL